MRVEGVKRPRTSRPRLHRLTQAHFINPLDHSWAVLRCAGQASGIELGTGTFTSTTPTTLQPADKYSRTCVTSSADRSRSACSPPRPARRSGAPLGRPRCRRAPRPVWHPQKPSGSQPQPNPALQHRSAAAPRGSPRAAGSPACSASSRCWPSWRWRRCPQPQPAATARLSVTPWISTASCGVQQAAGAPTAPSGYPSVDYETAKRLAEANNVAAQPQGRRSLTAPRTCAYDDDAEASADAEVRSICNKWRGAATDKNPPAAEYALLLLRCFRSHAQPDALFTD